MFLKRLSFGSKECTKELKLECTNVLGKLQWLANQSVMSNCSQHHQILYHDEPLEKVLLKREIHLQYIFSDRTLSYRKMVEALRGKQKFVHTLLKIALVHLESELD